MDADVDGLIGAGRHERSGERSTWRNGYRDRGPDTPLGTLNLKIPRFRTGAYFPGFLEPRKTVGKALVTVIQEAWISDAHEGLEGAVTRVVGVIWQRCRVHSMRNALAPVPKGQNTMVAAAIRQIFLQPDHATATQTWRHVADQLRARWPKLGACMDAAEHDVLAYTTSAEQHRAKLHSTNPLEGLNKQIKRRADVVGIFPNEDSITRVVGVVLLEQDDKYQLQNRYMQIEGMAALATPQIEDVAPL